LPTSSPKFRFFVTCARGTEGALRRELAAMRIAGAKGDRGGVWFEGPLTMGMAVCLRARVAVRVLMQLGEFDAPDGPTLYAGARGIPWRDWLTDKSTLSVHGSIRHGNPGRVPIPSRDGLRRAKPRSVHAIDRDTPALTHSGFAALKVKDAVVDVLRAAYGARPDVDTKSPDVGIVVHIAAGRAGMFLDLAGEALHRRAYRVAMVEAPLKETLAAAVLALGGARADLPFVDPMAGSGTLAIEHALAARGIAPGLRRRFGFERWPTLPPEALADWGRMRAEAEDAALAAQRTKLPPIVCADVSAEALIAARQNASAAGVDDAITFERADVAALDRRWPAGTLVTNPPYGERLKPEALGALYRTMARVFARLGGWRVVVLSGSPLW
jgi:23S rRNA G2445 N2-methylase RlmL